MSFTVHLITTAPLDVSIGSHHRHHMAVVFGRGPEVLGVSSPFMSLRRLAASEGR